MSDSYGFTIVDYSEDFEFENVQQMMLELMNDNCFQTEDNSFETIENKLKKPIGTDTWEIDLSNPIIELVLNGKTVKDGYFSFFFDNDESVTLPIMAKYVKSGKFLACYTGNDREGSQFMLVERNKITYLTIDISLFE